MRTFRFSPLLLILVSISSLPLFGQTPQKEGTATIAGVVTLKGEPARGVPVALQLQNPLTPSPPQPTRAKTDENGRFRITGLSAGQYTVGALAPGFVTDGSQSYGLSGKTVNVAEGETVENLELTLKPGGVITGRITDANGEPVAETNLRLSWVIERNPSGPPAPPPPPMNLGNYRTDDRGVYRIFGLAAGKYKVSVGVPMRDGAFSFQGFRSFIPETFYPDTTDETKAKVVEVEEGQEVTDIDIKAAESKKAYEISGRVVEAGTGKPVAGIGLSIGAYSQNGKITGNMSGGWRTDTNGEFQVLGARPGRQALSITNYDGKSALYSDPTPVDVIDSDVSGIEIRAQRGVTISGTVVFEGTNDPAMLATRSRLILNTLDIANPSSSGRGTKVNPDGSFHIDGLPPGKIRLNSYSNLPKVSFLRVEQKGAPLKDFIVETHADEQVTGIRVVYGYGDGAVRGQVKFIGGEMPVGLRLQVGCRRTESDLNTITRNSVLVDERGQFVVRDLIPGEYEFQVMLSFSGRPSNEVITKILPLLSKIRPRATVSNGSEAQVTITIDLSKEN